MTQNHFYEKKGPYSLNKIVKAIDCDIVPINKNNIEIYGFESLSNEFWYAPNFLEICNLKYIRRIRESYCCSLHQLLRLPSTNKLIKQIFGTKKFFVSKRAFWWVTPNLITFNILESDSPKRQIVKASVNIVAYFSE